MGSPRLAVDANRPISRAVVAILRRLSSASDTRPVVRRSEAEPAAVHAGLVSVPERGPALHPRLRHPARPRWYPGGHGARGLGGAWRQVGARARGAQTARDLAARAPVPHLPASPAA